MAELRTRPRVAVHYRLTLRNDQREGGGSTENVSERGAMLSTDIDPPLSSGEAIEVEFDLPERGKVKVDASVVWTSTVLPGMVGIEFTPPIPEALASHIQRLLAGELREQEAS